MKKHILLLGAALLAAVALSGCKEDKNFVEVSKADCHYLALKDGSTYIPIGLNFCWPPNAWNGKDEEKTLKVVEEQLDNLAKNGGNFVRIWISADFTEPEVAQGVYDENKAKRLDRIVEMCAKRGIKAKMCLPSRGLAAKRLRTECRTSTIRATFTTKNSEALSPIARTSAQAKTERLCF